MKGHVKLLMMCECVINAKLKIKIFFDIQTEQNIMYTHLS